MLTGAGPQAGSLGGGNWGWHGSWWAVIYPGFTPLELYLQENGNHGSSCTSGELWKTRALEPGRWEDRKGVLCLLRVGCSLGMRPLLKS